MDQQRCLGLAWRRYGENLSPPKRVAAFENAMSHLLHVYADGMRDATVLGTLAYLHWVRRDPACIDFADQALNAADCDPETRSHSLIVLGDTHLQLNNVAAAESAFEQLSTLRLRYTDWQMLGLCRSRLGNQSGAIAAFQRALELQPGASDVHLLLANEFANDAQTDRANRHRETATRLHNLTNRSKQ